MHSNYSIAACLCNLAELKITTAERAVVTVSNSVAALPA